MESIYESHIDMMQKNDVANLWLSHAYTDGVIHWHENLEILYFLKGECNVISGSDEVHAVPGDIVVVNNGDIHSVKCKNNPADFIILQIDFAFCEDMGFDLSSNVIKKIFKDEKIAKLITEAHREFMAKEQYYRPSIRIKILSILLEIFRKHLLPENENAESSTKMLLSKKIVKYVRHHFDENLSVEDVAKYCDYSRFYISKTFKETTGKTLVDYINVLKINKAKSLLQNSTLGMNEIAHQCGFTSQSYFSNVFKKYENLSPFEYKTNCKKSSCI